MNKLWSNLPNAHHIDWVLQSVKDNPDAWDLARDLARDKASDKALYKALDLVRYEAWIAGRSAAADAILALVAYDDSAKYLDMTYDELKVWATLSEDPASILLLPMVKAKELFEAKHEQVV